MAFSISITNLIQISQSTTELWHHIDFSILRPATMLDFVRVLLDHLRSATVVPSLVFTNLESIRFIVSEILPF